MAADENDFQRRARLGQADFERRAGGSLLSHFITTWWFFALVTIQSWGRVLSWPFASHHTLVSNVFALISLAVVVIGTVGWAWAKRHAKQKRPAQPDASGADISRNLLDQPPTSN